MAVPASSGDIVTNQDQKPYAYYVVSTNTYTTDGTWYTLLDSYTNQLHLTNTVALVANSGRAPAISVASVNGHDSLTFVSGLSNHLANLAYSATHLLPHELIAVVNLGNGGASARYWFSSPTFTGNPNHNFYQSGDSWAMASFTQVLIGPAMTNKWMIVDCLFYSYQSGSAFFTNNSIAITNMGVGQVDESGLMIGAKCTRDAPKNYANFSSMSIASLVTFTSLVSTVTRSNIFWYFTNKYAIEP